MNRSEYIFLDSGDGRRLESFGGVVVSRPAPAAIYPPGLSTEEWKKANLVFDRKIGWRGEAPKGWTVVLGGARLALRPAAQGQIGVFPEHDQVCDHLDVLIERLGKTRHDLRALNLFAYTGLATLRLAARLEVTETIHVDAAAGSVRQARDNARLSGLENARIRWLVEDALTFLGREARRGARYDIIIADPPAFGRSKKGGIWKLERHLPEMLTTAAAVLAPNEGVLCLTCHRQGWDEQRLRQVVEKTLASLQKIDTFSLDLCSADNAKKMSCGFLLVGLTRWRDH